MIQHNNQRNRKVNHRNDLTHFRSYFCSFLSRLEALWSRNWWTGGVDDIPKKRITDAPQQNLFLQCYSMILTVLA